MLYTTLWRLLLPLALLRLLWRSRREPGYRVAIGERLGLYRAAPPCPQGRPLVWLHAVSLGETRAVQPLLRDLRRQWPGMALLLTHMTATGRAAGAELLQPGDMQLWLPYDLPGAMRRFLARWQPDVGVLMETEVWPNLSQQARRAGVPLLLANARLSERSARRWQRWPALARAAWGGLAAAAAQTAADAQRLRAMGVADVSVLGNLKFDLAPDPELLALGRRWRQAAGGRPVLLLASTREARGQSEEALLLQALPAALRQRALLVWVPRHPQRFEAVAELLARAGFTVARRRAQEPDARMAVWLGDSMGEMAAYYAMADCAFIGGSLLPLGGQNLIEACACGCPVVLGPSQFNFAAAADEALRRGAALPARDAAGVWAAFRRWLDDEQARHTAAQHALDFAQAHRGAAQRQASWITRHCETKPRTARSH